MVSPAFMDSAAHLESTVVIKNSCNCSCFPRRKRVPSVQLPKLTDKEIQEIARDRLSNNTTEFDRNFD